MVKNAQLDILMNCFYQPFCVHAQYFLLLINIEKYVLFNDELPSLKR